MLILKAGVRLIIWIGKAIDVALSQTETIQNRSLEFKNVVKTLTF